MSDRTTIMVTKITKNKLAEIGKFGDIYDDIVKELLIRNKGKRI